MLKPGRVTSIRSSSSNASAAARSSTARREESNSFRAVRAFWRARPTAPHPVLVLCEPGHASDELGFELIEGLERVDCVDALGCAGDDVVEFSHVFLVSGRGHVSCAVGGCPNRCSIPDDERLRSSRWLLQQQR
jgi:hypothetical protein